MKKSILLLFAAFATLAASAHDFTVNGIYYNKTSSTTAEVTFKGGSYDDYSNEYSGSITIPATVKRNGVAYSVTSIGYAAFEDCSNLTAITIPKGVTSIGDDAFCYCSSLTTITIPESVTSIGKYAFGNCSSLTAITIPEGVTSIERSTFNGCSSLTTITIPESVTSIGKYAFGNCSSFTAITLPEGVTSIGDYAFYGCSNLTAITLPSSVTSIGEWAFQFCSNLTAITIPESVTSIGNSAFYNCSSLTAINIPENSQLTSIGEAAFDNCSSLTAITIPESVTSIGKWAFNRCSSSLTAITVAEGNAVYDSRGGCNAIIETNSNTLIAGCSTTIIPESVTGIGNGAFAYCSSFTAITIPESVTSIEEFAFSDCSSLESINIPEGVTSIGNYAFIRCSSLTDITIPESVTGIGNSAFSSCSSLHAITVAEGNAVYDSRGGCNAIIETNSNTLIAGCSTTIIPESVTSIGNYAFYGCSSLKSITIPEGVTSIGNQAFYGCIFTSDNFINNSTCSSEDNWGASLFEKEYDGVFIENNIVVDCRPNVTIATIPESVTSIGNSAFSSCSSLTAITIPESVTSIGNSAFSRCSSLTAITIPEGVTSIGNYAFYSCSSLTTITIPEGVTSIGYSAFDGCSSLTDITIPEGVRSIGGSAFDGCSSLTAITCNAITPPTIGGSGTFDGVDKSIPLYVPAGSVKAYKSASYWSEFTNIQPKNPVTEIILNQTSATLTEGETLVLTATVTPEDADDKSISWSSSNPSVATVDNTGKVTAVAPGTDPATITATANDGSGVSASCEVKVTPASYVITVLVDGEVILTDTLTRGSTINLPDVPEKEGYTFSGWGEVPETMPAKDVTVSGTFIINKYLVTFKIGDEVIAADSLEYGAAIVAPEAPEKEGYTFSGWSEIPETMPAKDVTVSGTFIVNKYLVTFMIDDEVIAADSLEYGAAIVVPEAPEKEGYTFSGWSEVLETMPAKDVTVSGTFIVNKYLVTFMIDDEVIAADSLEYGAAIVVPEAPAKEGYTFSGWSEIPETMPAKDVTVSGTFIVNKYLVTFMIDDVVFASDSLEYGATITLPSTPPTREGYTFSGWGEVAETVPDNDVTYSAYYIANVYKVYYFVGSKLVNMVKVTYGEPIPEYIYEPTTEGDEFLGWIGETYATMPAHDVTYTANICSDINAMSTDEGQQTIVIYDLHGRRVTNPIKGGIYIVGGKEMMVK